MSSTPDSGLREHRLIYLSQPLTDDFEAVTVACRRGNSPAVERVEVLESGLERVGERNRVIRRYEPAASLVH